MISQASFMGNKFGKLPIAIFLLFLRDIAKNSQSSKFSLLEKPWVQLPSTLTLQSSRLATTLLMIAMIVARCIGLVNSLMPSNPLYRTLTSHLSRKAMKVLIWLFLHQREGNMSRRQIRNKRLRLQLQGRHRRPSRRHQTKSTLVHSIVVQVIRLKISKLRVLK